MSTRITSDMVISSTLANINAAQVALDRTQEELSSGKSILEPSSNPYGASQIIDLQSAIDGLTSYEQSAQDGLSRMNAASGALTSMDSQVQRVRELVLQAANGTNSPSDLEAIAGEVRSSPKASSRTRSPSTTASTSSPARSPPPPPTSRGRTTNTTATPRRLPARSVPAARSTSPSTSPPCWAPARAPPTASCSTRCARSPRNLREGTPAAVEALAHHRPVKPRREPQLAHRACRPKRVPPPTSSTSRSAVSHRCQTTDTEQLANVQDANIAKVSMEYLQRARRLRSGAEGRRLDRAGVPA